MNILSLPTEILDVICNHESLDMLSKIYCKATCKEFHELVNLKYDTNFNLDMDDELHHLKSINEFIDFIYDNLVSSDDDSKTYSMCYNPNVKIIFKRQQEW